MSLKSKQFVLALDIGTSSVRAALYDHSGKVLPKTMVKNERTLETIEGGGVEIDADLAVEQVIHAVDDVLKASADIEGEITHVAASSFWHSLVGVDRKGSPTTKVLAWGDTRSSGLIGTLRKRFSEPDVHDRTGARFHSSYWPAKLLWIKTAMPDVWKRTSRWLSFSDHLGHRLCGDATTSISMASGTGLFNIRKCCWDDELIRFLKVDAEKLSPIAAPGETLRLNSAFAKRWPRLKSAKWFPAIGDGAANNIGAGCVVRSRAAIMIGTSGAMRLAFRGEPPDNIPPGLWCYRIDRERVVIGGALSDGGGLYQWLKDNLKLPGSDDRIEAELARRSPTAHGLIFLPFLAGERSTGYHETARGAVLGLASSTDPVDVVQAAMESVSYRFAAIYDQLKTVARIREVIASGGALRASHVWTRMIADILPANISLPDTREASSRGAVLLALESIGSIGSVEKLGPPPGVMFPYDRERHLLYKRGRKIHESFYQQLIEKNPKK